MEELWLPIIGFENKYEISNWGRVKSIARSIIDSKGITRNYPERFLSLKPNRVRGYTQVGLYQTGGSISRIEVHRLVAIHFLPNPDNLPVVNHINTIRCDNHVDNLEWCTYGDNLKHKGAFRKGREKIKKKIFQYTLDGDFIRAWTSATDIEKNSDVFKRSGVCHACNGIKPHYKGYIWKYE